MSQKQVQTAILSALISAAVSWVVTQLLNKSA